MSRRRNRGAPGVMQSRVVAVASTNSPEDVTARLAVLEQALAEAAETTDPGDLTVIFDNQLI